MYLKSESPPLAFAVFCVACKAFLKLAWRHKVIDGRQTRCYHWPQCNYNKRFCKAHGRLWKITTGNRCKGRCTLQNLTNLNVRDPNMLTMNGWKIVFFIGNDNKSRDLSPRSFKSRDWFDFENSGTYIGITLSGVCPCVCPVVTLSWCSRIAMFRRRHLHSSECNHYFQSSRKNFSKRSD